MSLFSLVDLASFVSFPKSYSMINTRCFVFLIAIIYTALSDEILYESKNSFCNLGGIDYPCTPPVTNIIKAARITVSSSCGSRVYENICPHWKYNVPSTHFLCPICSRNSFPPENLVDNHLQDNQTCWFSGPIQKQRNRNHVNITLSFNKRFEIYYLSLQFCSEFPDNVIISKSDDGGKTWIPWQYYSKDCLKFFTLEPALEYTFHDINPNPLAPTCIDLMQKLKQNKAGHVESILPFSPTMGRKLNESLIGWISVTDIRITLSTVEEKRKSFFDYGKYYFIKQRSGKDVLNMSLLTNSDQNSGTIYYGLSDISVGGRCQCHGHANKCILRSSGQISCDCEHNTDGEDCNKCMLGYNDVPWSRATGLNSNGCQRCHCNLHSSHCQFNEDIYVKSGYKSGGVCYKCLHNTAGRHCNYCDEGFYRDWSKPLSHEMSCLKCSCHTVGSARPSVCDKKSGQCLCKEGVTGRKCNQCKLGFRQTSSTSKPCMKKYEIQSHQVQQNRYDSPSNHYMANTESECKPCDEKRKRIRFKKFCRRNAVFMGIIQSKEVHGKMVRFEIQVKEVWSISGKISHHITKESVEEYSVPLWISHEDVRCECPGIFLGRTYLVLMKYKIFPYRQREELLLDSSTVMLQWTPSWRLRLQKFRDKAIANECQRYLLEKAKFKKQITKLKRLNYHQ